VFLYKKYSSYIESPDTIYRSTRPAPSSSWLTERARSTIPCLVSGVHIFYSIISVAADIRGIIGYELSILLIEFLEKTLGLVGAVCLVSVWLALAIPKMGQ
jgi:hypothetical protein